MSQASRIPGVPAACEGAPRRPLTTDILILSDGTVLAHNLTPGMATVLHQLNPQEETFGARVRSKRAGSAAAETGSSTKSLPGKP